MIGSCCLDSYGVDEWKDCAGLLQSAAGQQYPREQRHLVYHVPSPPVNKGT